jgi:hypothetical protein
MDGEVGIDFFLMMSKDSRRQTKNDQTKKKTSSALYVLTKKITVFVTTVMKFESMVLQRKKKLQTGGTNWMSQEEVKAV